MNDADLALAGRAVDGDQDALTEIAKRVQDPVYRLALRMTGRPPDAEDAVQEILIRILTRLSTFHGEAALLTWAYRIAVNHLVNHGKRPRREILTFDTYRQDLLDGLATPAYQGPDGDLLAEEIRLLCTQALLQCLDEPGRLAYVLGDVIGLTGTEAAWVLATTPATYRKRLERARRQVRNALRDRCGLLNAAAPAASAAAE
ncbi:RNA polymerase sigma factor [Yinghuangia aomiensis]